VNAVFIILFWMLSRRRSVQVGAGVFQVYVLLNEVKGSSRILMRSNNYPAFFCICVTRYPLQVRHKAIAQGLHRAFRFYRG
jgi:hypothetical protein